MGCAFVSNLTVRSFSLPGHVTVFTAELVAIHKALCFIDVSDCLNNVNFTDSLSSLWALNDFNTYHPILQDILFLLTSFDRTGKTVEFCWIPSHVGVAGNERADEAAKRAAGAQCTRFLPLPARDSFSICSTYASQKWQGEWENSGQSKLKAIKPRLAPWQSSLRTSRVEEVTLCRIRIGHTLATHRYLLCDDPRPCCSRCGEPLTVLHVLVSCNRLVAERTRFFGTGALSLRELLGDDTSYVSAMFRFFTYIGFSVIYSPTS